VDFVIIGAGMAGSALAATLSRVGSVRVLEQGPRPAMEGAAQNAGLIRRLDGEPCDRALAQRTHHFLTDIAPEWGIENISWAPGAILGMVRDPLWLHDARAHLARHQIPIHSITPEDVPALRGSPLVHAWHLPDERITDGPDLATAMLHRAHTQGAVVQCNTHVHALQISGGRVCGVHTSNGPVSAGAVILAGGAWAASLASTAGLVRSLTPLRRVAAITQPDPRARPDHPWCWLDDVGLYAKPHEGGWMVSPCDESPNPAPVGPGSTGTPTDSQWQLLQDKTERFLPALSALRPRIGWTGLRTFAPDRRPLLGEDGELPGLWWAAGLGGSGVSSCWGVAEAIATWIQGEATPWLDATQLAPHRIQLRRWPIFPSGYPDTARLIDA
jgi:D-arginine dehydrogenase